MKTLLLIDIQNDFLPGGALAVPEGDTIIPIINALMPDYDLIIATQDWHPPDHGSFAINHPGKSNYDQIELNGLPQTLWPAHCVQNTGGAMFAPGLNTALVHRVFPKGQNPTIDSYSGFFDNGHRQDTGLHTWLQQQGVTTLDIAGIATDYCVKFSVLDALQFGYKVRLLSDACRGVELQPGDIERAIDKMQKEGCVMVGHHRNR